MGRPTSDLVQLVVFRLDDTRFALPLAVVERVFRAVEVTPLPQAPSIVLGVVDLHGRLVPVLDARQRFQRPERAITPADWFLLVRTARGPAFLVVDSSDGIVTRPAAAVTHTDEIAGSVVLFPGVIALEDGLVLIHDVDRFLSLDERHALARALDASPSD